MTQIVTEQVYRGKVGYFNSNGWGRIVVTYPSGEFDEPIVVWGSDILTPNQTLQKDDLVQFNVILEKSGNYLNRPKAIKVRLISGKPQFLLFSFCTNKYLIWLFFIGEIRCNSCKRNIKPKREEERKKVKIYKGITVFYEDFTKQLKECSTLTDEEIKKQLQDAWKVKSKEEKQLYSLKAKELNRQNKSKMNNLTNEFSQLSI